ncbi:MAG: D-aminoacyl-tRNA deacylase [Candidatus Nanoarchaeia archaeon]|nr:D-aminoacyl-tRNA deacylase [Candidatus Nanoarchaeia archaeon]MDD5239096.1 D-aminoacyl-tRNA deacylase [Candidatus Nanoarchaeia archaeon]
MVALIASKKDKAALNISKHLSNVYNIGEESIKTGKLPETSDLYIFLSKHKSESGKATLTAHFPGNFGEDNSYGGEAKTLACSAPSWHKEFMKQLWKLRERVLEFQIVTEPTHHGPTKFDKPVLFVEIGSSEKEWTNEIAGKVVAEAVEQTIKAHPHYEKIAIAFGGGHYSEKFTDLIINDKYAIGHIAAKHSIDDLTGDVMDQMVEKSAEPVEYCLIDWNGCNQKQKIIEWAKNRRLEVIKV